MTLITQIYDTFKLFLICGIIYKLDDIFEWFFAWSSSWSPSWSWIQLTNKVKEVKEVKTYYRYLLPLITCSLTSVCILESQKLVMVHNKFFTWLYVTRLPPNLNQSLSVIPTWIKLFMFNPFSPIILCSKALIICNR